MNQSIRERLDQIYERDGELTPDAVIEDARDDGSPLHGLFNWDIKQAAMSHWRDTARRIIRSVKIEIHTTTLEFKPRPTEIPPEFIHDPDKDASQQGYVRCVDIRSDSERAFSAMQNEVDRIESSIKRAKKIASALGLEKDLSLIETAVRNLAKRMRQVA